MQKETEVLIIRRQLSCIMTMMPKKRKKVSFSSLQAFCQWVYLDKIRTQHKKKHNRCVTRITEI